MEARKVRKGISIRVVHFVRSFFFAELVRIDNEINKDKDSRKESGKATSKASIFSTQKTIHLVAKEFGLSWFQVTQMNVYTYSSRCKFIENRMKEEYAEQKKNANKSRRSRKIR
jgi:hypothetical protein